MVGLGGSFWPVVDGRLNLAPSAQEKAAWWPGSKETEEWVSRPDRLRAEILKWEKVLQDRPYDQGVLLQLAVLNWQVYEEQKALEYFARAKYLDPNNAEVRRLGESIFLF
nr:hypothetical protein [uncultured bacterium]